MWDDAANDDESAYSSYIVRDPNGTYLTIDTSSHLTVSKKSRDWKPRPRLLRLDNASIS